jgi:hypothetical protein
VFDSTTHDPIRQLMEEWDAANRPGVAPHLESPEWQSYESDRQRFLADAARSAVWADDDATAGPDGSDLEWLSEQARYYRSAGSDVARLAADALSGVAAAMAGAGHFDAGGYRESLADRGVGLVEALAGDAAGLLIAAA